MTGFSALPIAEAGSDQKQKFKGVSRILGPPWAHLPTLTVGLLGVQIFWSVEMSYASPYLLSLGITKSNMAAVFIAGPLSGLLMQPLIGVLADNSTSRFGRRRPYMIIGCVLCTIGMLLLGYTRPFASIFTGQNNASNDSLTIWLAVFSMYLIDFSVNAVQAVDRALLVDTLPSSSQPAGNAWAARMLGLGSVVGFYVGNINLPGFLPFLGKSQLQVLSVVVSVLLFAGHLIMAGLVKERILVPSPVSDKSSRKSLLSELRTIWSNIFTLPRVIRQICIIQFFAWLGWFPILFYSTLYVGDLYKRTSPLAIGDDAKAALDAEATRLGSRALFYSSLLALLVNLVLPAFVAEAVQRGGNQDELWWEKLCRVPRFLQVHLASLWAVSHLLFAVCMMATFFTQSVFGATFLLTITGFSWAITQWAPFSLLAEAILTEPASASTEDNASIRLADTRTRMRSSEDEGERAVFLSGQDEESEDEDEDRGEEAEANRRRILTHSGAQLSRIDVSGDLDDYEIVGRDRSSNHIEGGGLSAKAGIILGIHNVFIVIPQLLVTALSAIVFAILDPVKSGVPAHYPSAAAPGTVANGTISVLSVSVEQNITNVIQNVTELVKHLMEEARESEDAGQGQSNSVVYIFRFGGVAAMVAFILCWRLAREIRHR